jgi:hypothetical protein
VATTLTRTHHSVSLLGIAYLVVHIRKMIIDFLAYAYVVLVSVGELNDLLMSRHMPEQAAYNSTHVSQQSILNKSEMLVLITYVIHFTVIIHYFVGHRGDMPIEIYHYRFASYTPST